MLTVNCLFHKFQVFMEPEISLPCSQNPKQNLILIHKNIFHHLDTNTVLHSNDTPASTVRIPRGIFHSGPNTTIFIHFS